MSDPNDNVVNYHPLQRVACQPVCRWREERKPQVDQPQPHPMGLRSGGQDTQP